MVYTKSQAQAFQNIVCTIDGTAIGEVTKVPTPQTTADEIEVTNQDSQGYKEYIAGLKEGNEVEFVGNYVSTDAGQILCRAAADAGTTNTFVLTFPSANTVTFSAAVKTFDYIEDGGVLRFSCKAKVSGKPTYAADPVQLSALTISSGTLYPTFAAGTYNYFATASASPITVTPTSAGATITVNGTAVTSGQASGNITLTTGAINEVIISVAKDAKTTTFYKILVGR